MSVSIGVEYRSREYYDKLAAGWRVVSGPDAGADGVLWVMMEATE